jgi:quercetin dioxygenase-like cupin family protein
MTREPVPETPLAETEAGLVPEGDGWFVVNVADAATYGVDADQFDIRFERPDRRFEQLGFLLTVLAPGRSTGLYHAEAGQEDFLVLAGECDVVIEEQTRRLRRGDFVHCPPGTAHILVGAGDGPCTLLCVGARNAGRELVYPVSEAARALGASVERETPDPDEAYAGWPPDVFKRFPFPGW